MNGRNLGNRSELVLQVAEASVGDSLNPHHTATDYVVAIFKANSMPLPLNKFIED